MPWTDKHMYTYTHTLSTPTFLNVPCNILKLLIYSCSSRVANFTFFRMIHPACERVILFIHLNHSSIQKVIKLYTFQHNQVVNCCMPFSLHPHDYCSIHPIQSHTHTHTHTHSVCTCSGNSNIQCTTNVGTRLTRKEHIHKLTVSSTYERITINSTTNHERKCK